MIVEKYDNTQNVAQTGNFELRKQSEDSYFLYWLGTPIKHLTASEADELTALMNVPR